MSYLEEKKKELEKILPPLTRGDDFDAFWASTIAQAGKTPLGPKRIRIETPLTCASVYDVAYHGFDSTLIRGWLLLPAFLNLEKFPCVIHYHGFGENRGHPWDFGAWLLAGAAVLSVDCRDQSAETGNQSLYSGGQIKNIFSRGLLRKEEYYCRALYADALRAIDFAQSCAEIDAERIALEGASQGGGLSMAVAALDPRPAFVMADVPSFSHLEKRVEHGYGVFSAVRDYLRIYPDRLEETLDTLSYFDTMNMADKIRCPVFASAGLRDDVCPAELYFATYNRICSEKEIALYPFNKHEGGGALHTGKKLSFMKKRWRL
ncbi:MAG: acetylxylan esterase [Deltaproteobacteria bacterium]|jgi:cephalosporin-C deacetylase|nr:acetylxylan esterase [Deltaproteobacteria bacterium]